MHALQLVPFNTAQPVRPQSSQVLQLSAVSSTAEQSLLAHGLSAVYDPTAQEEAAPASKAPDARLVLQATPSDSLDTRSERRLAKSCFMAGSVSTAVCLAAFLLAPGAKLVLQTHFQVWTLGQNSDPVMRATGLS